MVVSLIIPVVILAIVVLLAGAAAGVKNASPKGGEDMIKKVYIYLVLFATLMMTIGGRIHGSGRYYCTGSLPSIF